ncbi:TPA: hypothetical protein N0F65_011408 [Lagenidium giganteum]|uniref:Uncharacterized protein n=1 Tax=Lagenidium giganteum TaxID=4803 RepID=A0AAV2ZDX8_9STRA|nr:TPA: hypothetical protein N0F65_011408 [Lagenidium giganteum]
MAPATATATVTATATTATTDACPVLRPTPEEFASFPKYIREVVEPQCAHVGVCKVVPPAGWFTREYASLDCMVQKPVSQHVAGKKGVFRVDLVERKSMAVDEFKALAAASDCSAPAPGSSLEEIERQFWKSLRQTMDAPTYGADIVGSLFPTHDACAWNLNSLNTILRRIDLAGITRPMLYFGMWRAMFAFHKEDMDLYSINYLHTGRPKFWYTIPASAATKFERAALAMFPGMDDTCSQFLRHKTCMISPARLKEYDVPFTRVLQEPGEFVITFPACYHGGFNLGFNIAEAVNFASLKWIPFGLEAKICKCTPDSVQIDMDELLVRIFSVVDDESLDSNAWIFSCKCGKYSSSVEPGNWTEATIADVNGKFVRLHYKGCSTDSDEWLPVLKRATLVEGAAALTMTFMEELDPQQYQQHGNAVGAGMNPTSARGRGLSNSASTPNVGIASSPAAALAPMLPMTRQRLDPMPKSAGLTKKRPSSGFIRSQGSGDPIIATNNSPSALRDVIVSKRNRAMSIVTQSKANVSAVTPKRNSTGTPLQHLKTQQRLQLKQQQIEDRQDEPDEASEVDDDESDRAYGFEIDIDGGETQESVGAVVYEDDGKVYHGVIDRRGLTPHVTFTTSEMPPSEVKKQPQRTASGVAFGPSQPVCCGFCSSTNLIWRLKCSFCGSSRMNDAPRFKYLVKMILSVEPNITAEEMAKRLLDFARFDRVAMRAEQRFKQASLVRAKAAITMMSRTIQAQRQQVKRMIFGAWKRTNSVGAQHDKVMLRLIAMKDIQVKRKRKQLVFTVWHGHINRIIEERSQRYAIASRRNDLVRLRKMMSNWQVYMRIRLKEKMIDMKNHYETERRETPNEVLEEMDKLKENLVETRRLVVDATNTIIELLQLSLHRADHDVQKTLQLKAMYPTTIGEFFDAVHGQETLDALTSGHVATTGDYGVDDANDEHIIRKAFEQTREKVEKAQPYETLVFWFNFQRRRAADTLYLAAESAAAAAAASPNVGPSLQNSSFRSRQLTPGMNSRQASSSQLVTREPSSAQVMVQRQASSAQLRPNVKLRKDKKKEFKEIKGLQDLRMSISSPTTMLKLLCHMSTEAQAEYETIRGAEAAASTSAPPSESTASAAPSTALSAVGQLHLKTYFKVVHRALNLPPDVVTKDSFTLNDFDSLYAFASYLLLFHPNYVAPGQLLSARYHLSYNFLLPQWERVQKQLVDHNFDPLAQQQYHIFLAKVKRVHKQFLRFLDISRYTNHIARAHQEVVLRDTYNDFTRRVLGKDSNVSIALEKETLASWVALPRAKLATLCAGIDEFDAIEHVFKDNVLDLVKIFRTYGSAAGGKGILEQEFLKVMTKAGMTDKKKMLRSELQIIYQQSRAPPPATAGSTGSGNGANGGGNAGNGNDSDSEDDGEDHGASPNEFFEALVRVAHHMMQKRGTGVPGGPTTLLDHVVELFTDRLLPLTKKFQEQGLTFKKQMVHPEVQMLCKAQEKKLKRVFTQYSNRHRNAASRGKLMDLSDFEALLKDRRLVDALFSHNKIRQLASFVQQDGDLTAASTAGDTENEFVYSEFVEALAAIAVFRNANPYIPFAKKLETFFDENFG